jgi:hypothetical protein
MHKRNGFILYVVIAILLALALLAFALNSFKSGAVVQLSRNIDQNRLTIFAKSANAEVLALLRTQANIHTSHLGKGFRKIFEENDTNGADSLLNYVILDDYEPPTTIKLAEDEGFPLKIKSRVVLNVHRRSSFNSVRAYNAYIDIFSQAVKGGFGEKIIAEVQERRDIRLNDFRHYLDKYVLFVKNYSPDLNNPHRRIIVEGIDNVGPHISRVYLGNNFYPDGADTEEHLWLDVNYEDHKNLDGFKEVFRVSSLQQFSTAAERVLFSAHTIPFVDLQGITENQFYHVTSVKNVYEGLVNDASNAANEITTKPENNLVGAQLYNHCRTGMSKLSSKGVNESNSAAYGICKDFVENVKNNYSDYSSCNGFIQIFNNCKQNWQYRYGYLDAASVWKIFETERPNIPNPQNWVNAVSYKGLSEISEEFEHRGPYFNAFLKQKSGKVFNPEKLRVGKMLALFGEDNKTPTLVEGPAFLRFFKIAFLDEFVDTIEIGAASDGSGAMLTKEINPAPISMPTVRLDEDTSFLNTQLNNNLSPSTYFTDKYMMSYSIDQLSVNALIGTALNYYDGDGNSKSINPITTPAPTFEKPIQKTGSNIAGTTFARLVDLETVSYNYPTSADFLANRVGEYEGKRAMFIEGVTFIESGDLDLTNLHHFYGKGLIFLREGNCRIGNLERVRDETQFGDSLRIYLQNGDFVLTDNEEILIEASLGAFTYPMGTDQSNQGSLIFNGQSKVKILGNLLVDYLYTQDSGSRGLKKDGKLIIQHDPFIYEPAAKISGRDQDPYHVSIGPVITAYAINTGEVSF